MGREYMGTVPREAGKSSFDLIDPEIFLSALPLAGLRRVVDLGCGIGLYAMALAERVGPAVFVHGVDLWAEGVDRLVRSAGERGLTNVTAEVADLAHLSSTRDGAADLVLLATVVHDLAERGTARAALREAGRIVRHGGWLAVVEFKKEDTRPGPPVAIRLAPEELARLVGPAGFGAPQVVDLGPSLYLALFPRVGAQ